MRSLWLGDLRKWNENPKLHMKGMDCDGVKWIHLAQGTDQWRRLVKKVMKLRTPILGTAEWLSPIEECLYSMELINKFFGILHISLHRMFQLRGWHSCFIFRTSRVRFSDQREAVLRFLMVLLCPFRQIPWHCFKTWQRRSSPNFLTLFMHSQSSFYGRYKIYAVEKALLNKSRSVSYWRVRL